MSDSIQSASKETASGRSPLPDIADIVFLLVMALLLFLLPNFVLGDGSTGWHLLTGRYILQHLSIPQHDLFSYTFPDRAWVPYEWLADVIGAGLEAIGGIKLVAVVTSAAIAMLFGKVYLECRKSHCHFLLAISLTILGVLVSSIHWLARPHLFTWFGVLLFAQHLEKYRRGEESAKRLAITLCITMVVWANSHPAFLIGLVMVAIYLCSEVVGLLINAPSPVRTQIARRATVFGSVLGLVFLSTLINPNAAVLYSYIHKYLHSSVVLANTNEFMPPNFHQLHAACEAILFALLVAGLAISREKLALGQLLTVLAFGWLGLTSMRNEPLFAIIAVPVIAQLFSNADYARLFGGQLVAASWLNRVLAVWNRLGESIDSMEFSCDMHIIPIALTALLVVSCFFNGKIAGVELVTSEFDPKTKPVATLEYIKQHALPFNKGFNLDNWGGYIAYKTGNRVFIDDRLDFYGEPFFLDYGAVLSAIPGKWEPLLDKHAIQWVLFPKTSPLAAALATSPNWKLACEDQASCLYLRK